MIEMSKIESLKQNDEMVMAQVIVKDSIDLTLRNVLGESGAKAIFFYIGLVDYDRKAREFHVRLLSILGKGAYLMERRIIKDLYERLEIPLPDPAHFDYERSIGTALEVAHEMIVGLRRMSEHP